MKTFLVILAVIIIAAGVYFYFGTDSGSNLAGQVSSGYDNFLEKLSALNNLKNKGLNTLSDASNFIDSASQKFTQVTDFLKTAPEKVSSTISGLYSQIKGQLPPAAVNLLSGGTDQSLQNFISTGGQVSVATTSGASPTVDVCVEFNNNSGVDYSVQNPFSPPAEYSYQINWGDGKSSNGKVGSGDGPLLATHHYANPGNYENSFDIISASTTLSTKVHVCIR